MTARQTITATITIDVPAVADWDAVKYPGSGGWHPEDAEPPISFREDLVEMIRVPLLNQFPRDYDVITVRVAEIADLPDPVVYDPETEEPF